jgi:hypothetical protein
MTETLAAFLAILSLWCLARFDSERSWFNAGLAGGAMGLAVLCRPTFLPWLGLVGIGMLLVRGRIPNCELRIANCRFAWADMGWRVGNCVALVAVAGMVMSPWVVRNQRVFGKPIVTTTHGGYTLLLGNNTDFYQYLRSSDHVGLPWVPHMNGEQGFDAAFDVEFLPEFDTELHRDVSNEEHAWSRIKGDPAGFALAAFYRLRQLWSPLPNRLAAEESTGRRLLRYAVAAWYCGVYLLAAVGIWRLRWQLFKPPWVWGVLLCVVFTGVHTFYWSNLRMRAPLIPLVALVAAAGVVRRK